MASYFESSKREQMTSQAKILKVAGKTERLPHELANSAHALASKFLDEVADGIGLACEKGCSYCCHQPATAFPFEAIRIASVLREKLSQAELGDLRARMTARVRGFEGASVKKNVNNKTACPLLAADGSCSVYEQRPLTCRMAHSFSVKKCRVAFQKDREKAEIPISLELLSGISGIIEAAFDELPKAKLDANLYELCSVVLAALDDEHAARKWANGAPAVFKSCIKDDT